MTKRAAKRKPPKRKPPKRAAPKRKHKDTQHTPPMPPPGPPETPPVTAGPVPIAETRVVWIDASGSREGRIAIAAPEPGDRCSMCRVFCDCGDSRWRAICGVDHLQALLLALQTIGFDLYQFRYSGGRVEFANDDDDDAAEDDGYVGVDVADMFGALLRAPG